ncbi:unnamed protein product [Diamesa serratosioi]
METNKISPHKCCICGYLETLNSTFSIHEIPKKKEKLADAWQKATGINKNLFMQGGVKVCSRHFDDSDLSPTAATIRSLNSFAIPSNNLEFQEVTDKINKSLNNLDSEMSINSTCQAPKQFNDCFLDFLKSKDSEKDAEVKKNVSSEKSCSKKINIIQDETVRIDFHNQASTSKQLFTTQPTNPLPSDYTMHYYDIDPKLYDYEQTGAIKRQRLDCETMQWEMNDKK